LSSRSPNWKRRFSIRKDQLIARTWPDTVVDEGALRVHVAALRKALGDGRAEKSYIANTPGRGYSFIAPVTREQRQPVIAPANGAAVHGNLPAPLTRIRSGRDRQNHRCHCCRRNRQCFPTMVRKRR
jgi:hypothetical protein